MPTSTVTSKGQLTIPVEVRQKLGIHAGSRIDFVWTDRGGFEFRVITGSVKDLAGMFGPATRTLTVEEMDDAIGRAVSE